MNINEYDEFGRTPLMNAVMQGDLDEVRRLIALGADPFKTDKLWGTSTAADFATRLAKKSEIHRQIHRLFVSSGPTVETDSQDVRGEDVDHPVVAEMHRPANLQPPAWCRAAAFAERFAIRSFRVVAGAVIVGIAIWLIRIAVDTLSEPFASLSPLALLGGILAGIVGILLLLASLAVAFGEKGDSRIEVAWRERR